MIDEKQNEDKSKTVGYYWKTAGVATLVAAAIIGGVNLYQRTQNPQASVPVQHSPNPTSPATVVAPIQGTPTPTPVGCQQGLGGPTPSSSYDGSYSGPLSDGTPVTISLHQPDGNGIAGTAKTPDGSVTLMLIALDASGYHLKVTSSGTDIWVILTDNCRTLSVKDSVVINGKNRTGQLARL